jgi:hypothetical protein
MSKTCKECGEPVVGRSHNALFCCGECKRTWDLAAKVGKNSRPKLPTCPATTGAIAELVVCADLLKRGFEVFRAVSPACSCDLVALRDGQLQRIEVKTGFDYVRKDGGVTMQHSPSRPGNVSDRLVVVERQHGRITYHPPLQESDAT